MRQNAAFNAARCEPFVWNICDGDAEIPVAPNSLDYILCIYVLSAVPPEKLQNVARNLSRLLKLGGQLYVSQNFDCLQFDVDNRSNLQVKDYGRHDLTQLRFKKDRFVNTNCYARGDGTLVYFFE